MKRLEAAAREVCLFIEDTFLATAVPALACRLWPAVPRSGIDPRIGGVLIFAAARPSSCGARQSGPQGDGPPAAGGPRPSAVIRLERTSMTILQCAGLSGLLRAGAIDVQVPCWNNPPCRIQYGGRAAPYRADDRVFGGLPIAERVVDQFGRWFTYVASRADGAMDNLK